jgi:hypothetical protein
MAAPNINSITPNTGPADTVTAVTIGGNGFTGATEVTFGGIAGTNLVEVSDTEVTVDTPGNIGFATVDVTLVTPEGDNTMFNGFVFEPRVPIDPGGNTPPIVVEPGTYIPGETQPKTEGTFPYTLVLPTLAFMPLVQGVLFNLSGVPPWDGKPGTTNATPPPLLTMTRTPPFPAYPS